MLDLESADVIKIVKDELELNNKKDDLNSEVERVLHVKGLVWDRYYLKDYFNKSKELLSEVNKTIENIQKIKDDGGIT